MKGWSSLSLKYREIIRLQEIWLGGLRVITLSHKRDSTEYSTCMKTGPYLLPLRRMGFLRPLIKEVQLSVSNVVDTLHDQYLEISTIKRWLLRQEQDGHSCANKLGH
jgi:hypothetical protein